MKSAWLRSRWRLCRLTDAAYPLRVQSVRIDTERLPWYRMHQIMSLPGLPGQSVCINRGRFLGMRKTCHTCYGQIATVASRPLNDIDKRNQISIMIGKIIGLRFAFRKRYCPMSLLIVDLIVAQSEILRDWQTSMERVAIMRSASIRSSLSLA